MLVTNPYNTWTEKDKQNFYFVICKTIGVFDEDVWETFLIYLINFLSRCYLLLLYFIKMHEHVEINMYDLMLSISTSFTQIAAQKIQMLKTIQQSQLTSLCCLYFKLRENSDLFVANLLTHLMPLDSFCTP